MLSASELKAFLRAHGVRLTKRLGQHHVVDPRVVQRLMDRLHLSSSDTVVEIGSGLGALTEPLAAHAGRVIAVDVDQTICALLRERLAQQWSPTGKPGAPLPSSFDSLRSSLDKLGTCPERGKAESRGSLRTTPRPAGGDIPSEGPPANLSRAESREAGARVEGSNVTVVCGDILEFPWNAYEGSVVVGAIPYHITSPIIVSLCDNRRAIREAWLILQEEVARRLTAKPSTKAYGRLSVLGQYGWEIAPVMAIPRRAFFPQPEVDSTCL